MKRLQQVGVMSLAAALAACGSGDSSGSDASVQPPDAAASGADAMTDSGADASVTPVQLGGWRMRGRDRQRSHRMPAGLPASEAAAAAAFLTLEEDAFISDVVIDAGGNLYLGVRVSDPEDPVDQVRSYTPAGDLRWDADLADFPRQLALGDEDQVYSILVDATATQAEIAALDSDGAPLWSVEEDFAQDLAVTDSGDLLVSVRDADDAYALVRLLDDGSEAWRLDEGGEAFAVDGQGNVTAVVNTAGETSLIEPATSIASFDSEGEEQWRHPLPEALHDGALMLTEQGDALAAMTIVNEGGVSTGTYLTRISAGGDELWQVDVPDFLPLDFALVSLETSIAIPGHTAVGLNATSRARSLADGAAIDGTLNLCHQALLGDAAGNVYSSCDGDSIRAAEADGTIVRSWDTPDTHQVVAADDGTIYLVPALHTRRNELLRIAP